MGPRRSACGLFLALVLLALPGKVVAAGFDWHPSLRVEAEYNDNVFLSSSREHGDFVTSFYPGFVAAAGTPRTGVELNYELGVSYYASLAREFTRHAAGLRAYDSLSPHLNVEILDTFYRWEDVIEPGLGTLAVRSNLKSYDRNIGSARLNYTYAPESELSLIYTSTLLANEDPTLQDSLGNRVGIEVRHALSRYQRLELGYSFERGDFEQVPVTTFAVIPSFDAHRAQAGYTYDLTRHFQLLGAYAFEDLRFDSQATPSYRTHEGRGGVRYLPAPGWSATISGGYFRYQPEPGSGFGGLAADVLLQKVFETGVASVSYRRSLGEDFYSGDNLGLFRYWTTGAGFTYYLRRHLHTSLDAAVGERHYAQAGGRDDTFWSLETALVYRLTKRLEAGLRYQHYYLRTTTPFETEFTNNRYIATIGATY